MLKRPARQRPPAPSGAPAEPPIPMLLVIALMILHVPLALAMKQMKGTISTYHALAMLAVGVYVACTCRRPITIAYVAAYVSGVEVIWRMTKAKVFTEWGKLIISVFVIIVMFRFNRAKRSILPLIYFALLIPSCLMIFPKLPYDELREAVPYTMSGPFALMACAFYFSGTKVTPSDYLRILLGIIIPMIGLSSIIAFTTITAADFDFSVNVRNVKDLSLTGGFGPNQVSSTLGLGVLAAFMAFMHERTPHNYRPLFFAITAGLAAQAAMTFSRTGIYLATGSIITACIFFAGDAKRRGQILLFLVTLVLASIIIFPLLNTYTGGALGARFQNTDTTGRDNILFTDLLAYSESPAFGLGVDQGPTYRSMHGAGLMESHVEWTRMLAEHGTPGLIALLILIYLGLHNLTTVRGVRARALVASMLMFTLLYTSSCGMRLSLASFVFGLACAALQFELPPRRRVPLPARAVFSASPPAGAAPPFVPGAAR